MWSSRKPAGFNPPFHSSELFSDSLFSTRLILNASSGSAGQAVPRRNEASGDSRSRHTHVTHRSPGYPRNARNHFRVINVAGECGKQEQGQTWSSTRQGKLSECKVEKKKIRAFRKASMIRRHERQDGLIITHKISSGTIRHVGALFTLSDLIQQKGFHLLF